jgi:hypothetical protein
LKKNAFHRISAIAIRPLNPPEGDLLEKAIDEINILQVPLGGI